MDDTFDPNDYADLDQLMADVRSADSAPASAPVAPESGTAAPAPAITLSNTGAAAGIGAAAVLAAHLADIERRLLAIETLARRNGWSL